MIEGDLVGRYQIVEEIAEGGMGVVYRAWDPKLQRDVALKLLAEHLKADEDFNRRFDREARIVARLQHPSIVPVYDVGMEDGRPYLVMGYIGGGTLRNKMEEGALSVNTLWPAMIQVASALDAAHHQDIIHRDIKPNNILFDDNGDAYVTDFGIAKIADAVTQLTGQALLGTPAYMSPEQFKGANVTGKSDLYSLATVIFEALTGQVPFEGETLQVMYKHVHVPPPAVHELNGTLSAELTPVMEKALAKDAADRYATVSDFITAAAAVDMEQEDELLPENHEEERLTPPLAVLPVREQKDTLVEPESIVDAEPAVAGVAIIGETASERRPPKPAAQSRIVQGAGGEQREKRSRPPYLIFALIAIALLLLLFGGFSLFAGDTTEAEEPIAVVIEPTETATATLTLTIVPSETPEVVEPTVPVEPAHTVGIESAGPGSRWQAGSEDGTVNGGDSLPVPADSPLRLRAGSDRLVLALPRGELLILDSNGELELHDNPETDPAEDLKIILFAGNLLLQSEEPAVVENPFGANIHSENGLTGVSQSSSPYLFQADCLAGTCIVGGDLGIEEQVELRQGEASQVGGSGRPGAPVGARYHVFASWSDAVPTPTNTPTATNTAVPTPTETPTPTATPTFTRRPPTLTSTPAPDTDGDGIPDHADQCPGDAGPAENGGCPDGGGSKEKKDEPKKDDATNVPPGA